MSIATRPLTYDDLRQMPDDGKRYEVVDGALLVSPSPTRAHQKCLYRLIQLIGDKVDADQLGEVYPAPVDVRLSLHDIVQPDLLFIRQDRLNIYNARGDVQGPPDLVVEIISPSSRQIDPGRKAELYARAGVPEYWLVDPETRQVRLYELRDGRHVAIEPVDGRYLSKVIPGLLLDPVELFANID